MLEKCGKKKKKNKRGESEVGVLVIMFIAIVVGIALVLPIFQEQGTMVNTVTLANGTYTAPTKDASIDLIGQELLSTPVVYNGTALVNSSNYTIAEGISATTGLKTIRYTNLDSAWNSKSVNVSYSYGAAGYIEDAGARGLAGQIGLFSLIALLAGVIYYYAKSNGWLGL